MADYDGLLLDHDGVLSTLTDRETLEQTAHAALRDAGVDSPSTADAETLSIRVSRTELSALATRHSLTPRQLWQYREDRIEAVLRDAISDGRKARYDDVPALASVDVPAGVVSNNQQRIVEYALKKYDIDHWFETVVARDPTVASLREKKPEPTYLHTAISDIGCSNPLFVGDSETDIVAATRAGVDVAFLRRGHNADTSLATPPTYDVGSLDTVVDLL